jgi:phosphatidylinositol glycan class B
MINKMNFNNIFFISILFHLIAAIFSTGFHHFDEHFQIYEYLSYKMGNTSTSELSWEFPAMMRSWFQVYIYWFFIKINSFLGISSPFLNAFVFRLFNSMLGVYALYSLIPYIKEKVSDKKVQITTFALLNFFWFVPYIQTRTNAESLSSSLFILGFSFFLNKDIKKHLSNSILAGIFFGAAYLCRFQVAIMVMFIWFWALLYKEKRLSSLLITALGIILLIILGVYVDFLGYEKWTFTPWNLLNENLILGKMKNFGVSPWWYYITKSFKAGIPPLSLILLTTTLFGAYKFKKSPITWIIIPFLLFHSYLGHKELRFIFPVILLTPLYIGFLLDNYKEKFSVYWNKKYFQQIIKFCITLNFIVLVASIFKPANPSVNFYKYVFDNNINLIKTHVENPYTMLGLNLNFYKSKNISVETIKDYKKYIKKGSDTYLFFNKGHHILAMEKVPTCNAIYMAYPRWSLNFNIGNWISRSRVWSLYYCN